MPTKYSASFIAFAGIVLLTASLFLGSYSLTSSDAAGLLPDNPVHRQYLRIELEQAATSVPTHKWAYLARIRRAVDEANTALREANQDPVNDFQQSQLLLSASFLGLQTMPGGFYTLPVAGILLCIIAGLISARGYLRKTPGLTHAGTRSSSVQNRGYAGIVLGTWLILFYIVLYWFPEYLAEWIKAVNPVSLLLTGNTATQWFLYGFVYSIAVLVMGVRMLAKYRHNNYQLLRTASVIFFQLSFAFLIPEILEGFNKPFYDFKNMWPLKYDFFFDWNLSQLLQSGRLGIFMLVWGIALFAVILPVMTYFYGKRWYCSWVCGCGGLAETLGDPFRHLSDKSLKAWKIERWTVHGVLVLIVIVTVISLYTFFTGLSVPGPFSTYDIQKLYGFMIGSIFAGVVGTGFYPLMGNRVWCRFGCPLAAVLGIVQRFKSRFRITVNSGQCISCGNCSTYCEMGIDVKAYAQRGQDVVRASCVGCGMCAEVCPRGVLRLENK